MRLAFATGSYGEFSFNGGLPWGKPIKEDMDHFKRFCHNKTLIMGYKTWVSMPEVTKQKYKMLVIFNRKDKTYDEFKGLKILLTDDSQFVSFLEFLGDCEDGLDKDMEYCLIGGTHNVEVALEHLDLFDAVLYTQVRKTFGEEFECSSRINPSLLVLPDTRFKTQDPYFYRTNNYDVSVTVFE